ncbi:MAG: hypothetical protein JXO72_10835, partial [Vicinamibacteria bacterium]|nr:hypothetical protein [Vicinamibacteria bacterium]
VPRLSTDDIANLVREISPRVEEIRGLRFIRPVQVRVAGKNEARAHFKQRIHKYWPEERMRHDARVFAHLGLLPTDLNFTQLLLSVLEEQAGGFYDPESRALVILDDMPAVIAPILLAHELTHALDDQYFDLDRLIDGALGDDDRSTALSAVVEGSGTLLMSVFLMQEIAAKRIQIQSLLEHEVRKAERLKAAPPLLQRSLLAPYILGQSFLLKGDMSRAAAGFPVDAVNQAFEKPPESTEQLLHPEKYWKRDEYDAPGDVTMPDLSRLLGRGWKLAASGKLGEMLLAVMTGIGGVDPSNALALITGRWTHEPSIGWSVDGYQHYVKGGQTVTILAALWDSPKDVGEFVNALAPDSNRHVAQRDRAVVIVAGRNDFVAENLARMTLDAITAAPSTGRKKR